MKKGELSLYNIWTEYRLPRIMEGDSSVAEEHQGVLRPGGDCFYHFKGGFS